MSIEHDPHDPLPDCDCHSCALCERNKLLEIVGALRYPLHDARRIVACVNACAGIPTEDLERSGISLIEKLREDEANSIVKQRDKLLKALQGLLPFVTGHWWPGQQADGAIAFAVAAAREAEGKLGAGETVTK